MEEELENNEEIFSTYDDGNIFKINFEKLFGHEKLSVYDDFDLTTKRNFKNQSKEIVNTYKQIFGEDDELNDSSLVVMMKLLSAQSKIIRGADAQPMGVDEFYGVIDSILTAGDKYVIKRVHEFIEENYNLSLDEVAENMKAKKKQVNEELFISDAYAKILLEISYVSRILIPIIGQFLLYNKSLFQSRSEPVDMIVDPDEDIEELIFDDVVFEIFKYIFDKVSDEYTSNFELTGTLGDALRDKLLKMVISRVVRTEQPAQRYWALAGLQGITIHTETLEIYKKLLTNSMTKLICSKELNIVSFFSAVINRQVDFLFSNKFKNRYQVIDASSSFGYGGDNDEDMSEFEKLEIRMARKDEGTLVLQNMAISDIVERLPEEFDVPVTDEEVQSMLPLVHKNTIQEKLISIIMTKYFQDTTIIKRLSAMEYCKILLCCKKYLEKHKFVLLTQILICKCEKQKERVGITGNRIKQQIENTKLYKDLFEHKYMNFKQQIDKQLCSIIGTIYASDFKDENGEEPFDTTIKAGNIAEELVRLVYIA